MRRVCVFTATRWELQAVRRALRVEGERRIAGSRCLLARKGNRHIWLIRTGIGMEKAGVVARNTLTVEPFDLVLSTGYTCALTASGIGDLVIGSEVTSRGAGRCRPEDSIALIGSPTLISEALDAAQSSDVPARVGGVVTLPRVLCRASEKAALGAETGAIGLDMESAAVGEAAQERHIPFLSVRAVSDLVDEDLPLDFNVFLKPGGWIRGTLTCVAHPSCWGEMNRLRKQSAAASRRLARFLARFLDGPR